MQIIEQMHTNCF